MGLVLLASILFTAACALAYADELGELTRRLQPAAAAAGPAPVRSLPTAAAPPLSMLDSLVRDLTSPDPTRQARALERLPAYPPGELSRRLVPMLAGPVDPHRDRVADLLLRCGGEEVLEPLHRYFLGRDAAVERHQARERELLASVQVRPFPAGRAQATPPRGGGGAPGVVLPLRRRDRRGPELGDMAFPPEVLSPDPELRARALADLLESGHPHGHELLCRVIVSDPDALVRAVAAAALGRAAEQPGGLETLEKATRDPDASVRWNACFALGKLGNRAAKRVLRFAENDGDGSVRLAARQALEALGLDPPMPGRSAP